VKRLARVTLIVGALLAISATPAFANHKHVMQLGNSQCVILAASGGEDDVELPMAVFDHNPNVTIAPAPDRLHPLHVLVHKGVPGTHNRLEVAGTGAADTLCSAGIVND
jgi:hypothetical protein